MFMPAATWKTSGDTYLFVKGYVSLFREAQFSEVGYRLISHEI